MKKIKMTKAELATMHVFWNSDSPLSIRDIPAIDSSLNPNTVAVAVKNLLKKEYIKVADITYHGTVLARQFSPVITQEQYFLTSLEADRIPIFDVVSAFVRGKCSPNELAELERIIEEQKKKDK